ncbi:MAG: DMT family transporter [Alphaproteobacteria bacterium]|nr:DMT family transporter [Alphaproteobacteria bacterium]
MTQPEPSLRGLARPLAILTGLMFVWGLSIPATKIALADFPPLALTAARYLAAAPCFAAFMTWRPLPPWRDLLGMAGLGMLGVVGGQILQSIGVLRTSASVATMLSATSPMFLALFAAIFLGQRIGPRHLGGMAVALAGVATIAWDENGTAGATLLGNAIVLSSTASIAAYYVLASKLIARHGVITVAGFTGLFGTLGLLPPAAWELAQHPATPSLTSVLIILYLGALVTVAGLWIWLNMLRTIPARVAAASQFLQPIFGVSGSALILGEPIAPRFLAGTALVLTGIALAIIPRRGD